MKIYLIGFMGCGKTKLGKALANRMSYGFIDLDTLIETEEEMTVPEIFLSKGEDYFRQVERGLLWEIQMENDIVVATGGGTPCHFDNMDFILKSGKSLYLEADAKFLYSRLKHVKDSRPVISDVKDSELEKFIEQTLAKRQPFYARANARISAVNCNVDKIISALETYDK